MNEQKSNDVINNLGFQENGGFIYNKNGDGFMQDAEPVHLNIASEINEQIKDFQAKGNLSKWMQIINKYGNIEQSFPYLFILLCFVGAPLLRYINEKNVVLTINNNLIAKIGMSIWHNVTNNVEIQPLKPTEAIKNMPLYLHCSNKIKQQKLIQLMFNYDSQLLFIDKTLINQDLMLNLTKARRNKILNIELPKLDNANQIKIEKILKENYGVLAAKLAFAFMKRNSKVKIWLNKYCAQIKTQIKRKHHNWALCGAIAFTAAEIINQLKLFNIDLKCLYDWFISILQHQEMLLKTRPKIKKVFKNINELATTLRLWMGEERIMTTRRHKSAKEAYAKIMREREHKLYMYVKPEALQLFLKQYYDIPFNVIVKKLKLNNKAQKGINGRNHLCYRFLI